MTNTEVGATIIEALDLDLPPIALTFVDQPPIGIDIVQAASPSSCSFWRRAEQQMFYVPAEAHFNCPVGAMVMGFELPEPVANELQQLVTNMCRADICRAMSRRGSPRCSRNQRELSTGRSIPSHFAPLLLCAG